MTEETVRLGPDGALCGVFTPPAGQREAEWGVLLLNAGVVHRVGPNRLYVRLARSLAPLGFAVLRFDFSGVGDSATRTDNPFFERRALEEVLQAMDWLSRHHGCRRFMLMGLCSGAEMAFKTACRDPRVGAAVLVNAPRYDTEPSRDLLARVARAQEAGYYWRVARWDPRRWLKLFSARVNYAAIVRAVGHRIRHAIWRSADHRPDQNPDVAAFTGLLRRDIRLLLLFSEGDWGFHYLQTVFGSCWDAWRANGNPRLEVVGRSDHTLTPVATQQRALQVIVDWARQLTQGAMIAGLASAVHDV